MKFLKKLFARKKNKLEEVSKRYEDNVTFPEGKKDVAMIRNYIIESCEQLTKDVSELSNDRHEYRTITNYLTDIQTIENLHTDDRLKIEDIAANIISLNDSRNASMEATKKMPDSQFVEMEKYKDSAPTAIRRMKENEENQFVLKRDMDYLEGEKLEWTYEKNALLLELKHLKRAMFSLIAILASLAIFFLILRFTVHMDAGLYGFLILGLLFIAVLLIILRMINDKTQIKQSQVNYNAAVTLQNRIKLRYVNATNAVDYAKEKYHVTSARDFEKQWELYLDICKEKERLERTNDDLIYYKEVLVKLLRKYQLYDAAIWQYQVNALVYPKEMVEIKHSLLERRGKVRSRLETITNNIDNRYKEIYAVAKEYNLLTGDIRSILHSVEQFLNPNEKQTK